MEKNKKSKLGLAILIGILITLVIGLTGFIVYDKVLNHDNKNNKNVEISVNGNLVKKLHLISGSEVKTEVNSLGLYNNEKVLIKDLSIENKENLLYLQLVKQNADEKDDVNSVSKWYGSTVKSLWTKIFGSTTAFELSDKKVNNLSYQRDGSVSVPASGRFEGVGILDINLIRATQSDEEIVLYEVVKFIDFDSGKYYSNIEKTNETTATATISANYKKVFRKDTNDNYYFYSIEKIK